MSVKLGEGATVVLRFGGWGDLFPVVCAARWMKDQFPDRPIDMAARGKEQVDFLKGLGVFRSVFEQKSEMGGRWVEWDMGVDGLHPALAPLHRLQDAYDRVVDFMDTVENNPFADHGNWYDLSLAFAGFDPSVVPEDMKRPYVPKINPPLTKDPFEDLGLTLAEHRVALSLAGSAPLRSMPREFWQTVVNRISERVDGSVEFLVLSGEQKAGLAPAGPNVRNLIGKTTMVESAALLRACDLAVCADTGIAHFAEGLGIPNITIYTTVRGWTRSMYHKHTIPVDTGVDCQCAALVALCPRLEHDIMEPLSGIQREIFHFRHVAPTPEPEIIGRMGIPPEIFAKESEIVEMYRRRLHGDFPPCVKAVDAERVVSEAVGCLTKNNDTANRISRIPEGKHGSCSGAEAETMDRRRKERTNSGLHEARAAV